MRPKSILLLVLALGCGLVASIGISQVMERRGSGGEEAEQVEVLVAKVEIPAGEAIKPEMVAVQKVPKNIVAADTLTKIEEVEGKRPNGKLLVGEIIREGNLGEAKAAPIPPGFRVNTIRATADRGGNLLKPGDRVDVQVYVRANAVPQVSEPTLQTFLTDVRVYAVDSKVSQSEEEQGSASTRTVSLLVTPEQAAKLTYASQIGQIQLVMRGVGDTEKDVITTPIDWKDIAGNTDSPGDQNAKAKPKDDLTPPKQDGFVAKAQEFVDAAKNLTPAAVAPSVDHFVMLEVRGDNIVQYTFGDPAKPPLNWGPVDGAASTTAPPAPAVDEPSEPGPHLRVAPNHPARNSRPAEDYEASPIE
ncbi:MAG: Flp pilus assembly protein CpaB [Planctomycetota bacterium]|nr:MAG: Flp pilus assembly protein CpaB [Planctomycetota bacterium]